MIDYQQLTYFVTIAVFQRKGKLVAKQGTHGRGADDLKFTIFIFCYTSLSVPLPYRRQAPWLFAKPRCLPSFCRFRKAQYLL